MALFCLTEEKPESINGLDIIYDKNDQSEFPNEFHVVIGGLKSMKITFKRVDHDNHYPLSNPDVYTTDSTDKIVKFKGAEKQVIF